MVNVCRIKNAFLHTSHAKKGGKIVPPLCLTVQVGRYGIASAEEIKRKNFSDRENFYITAHFRSKSV